MTVLLLRACAAVVLDADGMMTMGPTIFAHVAAVSEVAFAAAAAAVATAMFVAADTAVVFLVCNRLCK